MSQAKGGPSYGTDLPVQAPPAARPSCCPTDGKSCGGGGKRPPRHTPAPSTTAPLSPMTPGRRRGPWACCCCLRRPTLWGGLALGLVLVGGLLGMLFNATNREELSLVAMVLGVACVVQTASLLLATLSPPYRKSRAKLEDELEEREGEERTLRRVASMALPDLLKALGSHVDTGLSREEAGRRLSALRVRGHWSSYSPWLQQQWHSPHDACCCSTEPLDPSSASPPPLYLLAQALYTELWAPHTPLLWGLALLVALQHQSMPSQERGEGEWVMGLAEVGLCLGLILTLLLTNALRHWTTLRCVWLVQCGRGVVRLGPVRVVRGGEVVELRQSRLVPGDIVLLRPGQEVPAHVRLLQTWGGLELRAPPHYIHRAPSPPSSTATKPPKPSVGLENGPYARLLVQEAGAAPNTTSTYKTPIAPCGSLVRRGRARAIVVLRPKHPSPSTPPLPPAPTPFTVERLQEVEWGSVGLAVSVSGLMLVLGLLPIGARKEWSSGKGDVLFQGLGGALAMLWALLPHSLTRLPAEVMARGLCSVGGVALGERQQGVEAAVEALAKADVLVLDKAGTLTEGRPRLREIVSLGGPPPASPSPPPPPVSPNAKPPAVPKPQLPISRLPTHGQRLHAVLQSGRVGHVDVLMEAWLLTCAFADAPPSHEPLPPDTAVPLQDLLELEHEWDGLGPFDRAVLRAIVGLPEPAPAARCVSAHSSSALSALLHNSASPRRPPSLPPIHGDDDEVVLLPASLPTLPGLSMRSPLSSATSPRLLPPPVCSLLLRKLRSHTLLAEVPWDPRLRYQARSYRISSTSSPPTYRTYFRGSAEALLAHCTAFALPSPSHAPHAAALRPSLLALIEDLGRQGYSVQGLASRDEPSCPLPTPLQSSSDGPSPTPQGPVTLSGASRSLLDGCTFIGLLAFDDRLKTSAPHAMSVLTAPPRSHSLHGSRLRVVLVTGEGSSHAATSLAHTTGLLHCSDSSSGLRPGGDRHNGDEEAGLLVYDHLLSRRHPQVLSCSDVVSNSASPLEALHDKLASTGQPGHDPLVVLYKATPQDRMLVVRALVAGGQRVVVTGNGLGDVGAMSQQGVCGVLLGTKNNPTYTDAARHAAALLIDDNEPEALADVMLECRRLLSLLSSVTRLELASRLGIALLGLSLALPYGFPLQAPYLLTLALARSLCIVVLLLPPSGQGSDGLGALLLPCCSKAAALTQHTEHEHESSDDDDSDSSDDDSTSGDDAPAVPRPRSSSHHHHHHHPPSSTPLHVPSLLWQSLLLSLPLLLCALPLPLLMHERLPTSSTPPLALLLLVALLIATPLLPSVILRPRPLHWHYHATQASACATLLVLFPPLALRLLYPALPVPALLLLVVSPLLPLLFLLALRRTRVWHWPPCHRRPRPLGTRRPKPSSSSTYGALLRNTVTPSHLPSTPLSHPTAASMTYAAQAQHHPFLLLHPLTQHAQATEGPGAGVFFNAPSPTAMLLSRTHDNHVDV